MMKRRAAQLSPWLAQENLALYSQADGVPRSQMLDRFKTTRGGCYSAWIVSGKGWTCPATHW